MNNKSKKTNGRNTKQRNTQLSRGSENPPQLNSNIIKHHKFRFSVTSAFTGSVSIAKILGALGTVCTVVNTTVTAFNRSFKIRKIELWTPPPAQGSLATTSIEWLGSENSPSREVSDTVMSVSRPGHIVMKPPKNSLASFWQQGNSNTVLFSLVAPVGTVIDFSVDYIEYDDEATNISIAVATGVLGNIYYLALDHGTSDKVVPVSLSTTV